MNDTSNKCKVCVCVADLRSVMESEGVEVRTLFIPFLYPIYALFIPYFTLFSALPERDDRLMIKISTLG